MAETRCKGTAAKAQAYILCTSGLQSTQTVLGDIALKQNPILTLESDSDTQLATYLTKADFFATMSEFLGLGLGFALKDITHVSF